MRFSILLLLLLFIQSGAVETGAGGEEHLMILRITPNGSDVAASRQLVIQFDRPVVPLGRMERRSEEIPVKILPGLDCEWRWLNTSALACQLGEEHPMQEATHYRVTVEPGLKTVEGVGMQSAYTGEFITARPKVVYTRFVNWLSPGTPLIQVTFNMPVTKGSVESALSMQAREVKNSVKVGLSAFADTTERNLPYPLDENNPLRVDDRKTEHDGIVARRVWIVKPLRELPLDQTIWFDVSGGLHSDRGSEAGVENRTLVTFETYPEFTFLGIRCTPEGSRYAKDISYDDLNASTACAPLKPVALRFSAPVKDSAVKNAVTFSPRLDGGRKDYDPWENRQDYTHLSSPHRSGRDYSVWLPELLQAYREYNVTIDTGRLTDEFGRKLPENGIAFTFATAHREPRLHLGHAYAVLEAGIDSDIPLYVTNLDSVVLNYQTLNSKERRRRNIPDSDAEDIAYKIPLGVREILDNRSGVLSGSLSPLPKPPNYYGDPYLFAQVTPFQVHAKMGHFNSLVWVSDFAKGLPVASARVTLCQGSYTDLSQITELPYSGISDGNGLVRLPGTDRIDPKLDKFQYWLRRDEPRYFVKVEKAGDVALLPLDSNFWISNNGIYSDMLQHGRHAKAWGTTAQGIYKLGDTVEYKIYVREQSNTHWIPPEKESYRLSVYDPQDKVVHQRDGIVLNAFGAFDGTFVVPKTGTTGQYRFELTRTADEETFSWEPMGMLVSDFTPSPFKVRTELNGDLFKAGDNVAATSLATFHSGGPYSGAEVRLTGRLRPKAFRSTSPLARDFTFGSQERVELSPAKSQLLDVRAKLSEKGQCEARFALPETEIYYGEVVVESAVKDERGKFVASSATADFSGRDRYVGLKNTQWVYTKGKASKLDVLVVDDKGLPAAGTDVNVSIQRMEYKASRVKGPGNAFLTQNIMTWSEESNCRITSAAKVGHCSFTPRHAGYYRFIATVADSNRRTHKTELEAWVSGNDRVVWDQSDDATLQIVPEQSRFKIGDKARYLVKNPFPGAKALITVERYGILDTWVQTLERSTPIIEVPIKPEYLPGYYLSVLVVSPRVAKPLGAGRVDLGKPSYRMGYVQSLVNDPYKELHVKITTDKTVYKPRETVTAALKVETQAKGKRGPYEIAVAVVDESVLALNRLGNAYYDPYRGFNELDALDLNNYSLISRLIGRQKFEKKGANAGGDGGAAAYAPLRNLFKFVTYWNPSVPVNGSDATIEFTLPDNLTGWRIIALAVTPEDKMGMSMSSIKVNRPTEIRPVMPNQLLEGDRFTAGFNIMNRSGRDRTVTVSVRADGALEAGVEKRFTLPLKAYGRENVWIPLQTRGAGTVHFNVTAGDAFDRDALEETVDVRKRRAPETAATYGTTDQNRTAEWVRIPEGIHTDVGNVGVVLSPSVIGNIGGAFEYLETYPYLCWEQRLTKAVAASQYLALNDYLPETLRWDKAHETVLHTLEEAGAFQAPSGGMCYWVGSNAYVSPYLSAYTALAFQWLRKAGYAVPEPVESALHRYLLDLLRNDALPSFFSKGMSSTVRAVALNALSQAGKTGTNDILRYERHVPEMDLFGQSHYLQAALQTPGVPRSVKTETLDAILGHAVQSGGKFQFNEPWDDSYRYILATPLRSNCSILSALIEAQNDPDTASGIGDIPFKMVRSITQARGSRTHWENTQENLFCLNAISDYARVYESTAPAMQLRVAFDGREISRTAFGKKSDPPVEIFRPLEASDPGKKAKIEISKEGGGRFYYAARVAYDLKTEHADRINSGIELRREYSVEREGKFVLLQSPMQIRRSDIVKVDLFVSVPTARHFVVVHDPVPGGLEPVNSDLATASAVDAEKGAFKAAEGSWWFHVSDWSEYGRYFWSFYHRELKHDAANFYADYLPAGNYHLSYTAQAIAKGRFHVMPAAAEEMYDPDVYGRSRPTDLEVGE